MAFSPVLFQIITYCRQGFKHTLTSIGYNGEFTIVSFFFVTAASSDTSESTIRYQTAEKSSVVRSISQAAKHDCMENPEQMIREITSLFREYSAQ